MKTPEDFLSDVNPSLLSEFKLVLNDSSVQQLFLYMEKYAQYTADRSDTYFGILSSEKLLKMEMSIDNAIDNITPEEMEKYFPQDTRPKGWLSIEEYLPMMYAADIMQGYSVYKVKDKDGNESHSGVSDHNTWYYEAKKVGITHWWNE